VAIKILSDEEFSFIAFPFPDGRVRKYLQVMDPEPRRQISLQECWRLRYAAFLCAIFDVLATLNAESGFQPSEFAQHLKDRDRKSQLLANILDNSRVSIIVSVILS
jgi:hypothetical protein